MLPIRDNLFQAWRSWIASLKRGGSSLPVILTLSFAIGATVALFVLVKGAFSLLPYRNPEQLVLLWESSLPDGPRELRVSIPDYEDFVKQNKSFAHLNIYAPMAHNVIVGEGTERISSPQVGTGFFSLLGIRMLEGRDANVQDGAVVVLSEDLWRSRFPGWTQPIGQTLKVDGVDRQVIGIVPHGKEFPQTAKMWVPFNPSVETCSCQRNGHSYQVIGRLKADVTFAQADAEVKGIAARLAAQYQDTNKNTTAWVQPLKDQLTSDFKPAMVMLGLATFALLLMACISVAAILFAQGAYRQPEIAVRQVLGGTRSRILGQFLLESCFSAVVASGLGLLFALGILRLFVRVVPSTLPNMRTLSIDPKAIIFAIGLALITLLLCSLLPALYATRGNLVSGVRGGILPGVLGRSQRIRNTLIVVENTITFALLVVSILLLSSLVRLTNIDPGFAKKNLTSADLSPNPKHYSSPQLTVSLFRDILGRARALPGVESVSMVDSLPMTGSTEGTAYIPQGSFHKKPGEEPIGRVTFVMPGYFQTMSIPILHGRDFTADDAEHSHVMVISEGIARANWPGEDPIGKRIAIKGAGDTLWEVIGLVPDIKDDGLAAVSPQRLYMNEQEFGEKDMTVVVRSHSNPNDIIRLLRHEISAIDSTLPIYNITTVEQVVNTSIAQNQVVTRIVGVFSIMALLLAAVGIYGIILSNLLRRTKEFGIRIAVGASFKHVAWLVFREGLLLLIIGMIAGTVLSFAVSRSLNSLLFGVRSFDVSAYVIAIVTQFMVVAVGCLTLLRKISTLDPLITLKNG